MEPHVCKRSLTSAASALYSFLTADWHSCGRRGRPGETETLRRWNSIHNIFTAFAPFYYRRSSGYGGGGGGAASIPGDGRGGGSGRKNLRTLSDGVGNKKPSARVKLRSWWFHLRLRRRRRSSCWTYCCLFGSELLPVEVQLALKLTQGLSFMFSQENQLDEQRNLNHPSRKVGAQAVFLT